MVAKAGLATDIWASPGLLGGPLDARDPDVFVLGAIHPPDVPAAAVIDAADEQIAIAGRRRARTSRRCSGALARFTSALYRDNDGVASRTRSLGSLELLHGRAELLSELPDLLSAVDRRRRSPTPRARSIPSAVPCCGSCRPTAATDRRSRHGGHPRRAERDRPHRRRAAAGSADDARPPAPGRRR